MPVILLTGKQRVPQGLPLPILCYPVGEPGIKLSRLRKSPLRLRSLSNATLTQAKVVSDVESPFVYDDFRGMSWWSVIDTSELEPGVYIAELGNEFSSS